MKTMKKTYQAPTLSIIKLKSCYTLLAISNPDGLDGFGGSGGKASGKSADARGFEFDIDEE